MLSAFLSHIRAFQEVVVALLHCRPAGVVVGVELTGQRVLHHKRPVGFELLSALFAHTCSSG